MTDHDRAYGNEQDKLLWRWRIWSPLTILVGTTLIIESGAKNAFRDGGIFVFSCVILSYVLYLRDFHLLSKRHYESRKKS
jgi:hypothetical protein